MPNLPLITLRRYGSTLTVHDRKCLASPTVKRGVKLARNTSNFRGFRSISNKGATSRDVGIRGKMLKKNYKLKQ